MTSHFINPENPFVFNELIYSNQPHFQYNASALAAFHRFVNVLAPSLGIFGACLVGYLALSQTTYHFRAFSRMILLCSMTDVLYALCDLWTQAVSWANRLGNWEKISNGRLKLFFDNRSLRWVFGTLKRRVDKTSKFSLISSLQKSYHY